MRPQTFDPCMADTTACALGKPDSVLLRLLGLGLCSLLAVACGEDAVDTPQGGEEVNGGGTDGLGGLDADDAADGTDTPDAGPIDTAVGSDADDATPGSDIVSTDTADADAGENPNKPCATKGAWGCPCTSNDVCVTSGTCIETPKGQKCAKLATEPGGCAPDEKSVAGTGVDGGNICVPKYGKLCNPCNANAECQSVGNGDSRCVDGADNGSFCGAGCQSDTDCAGGYECKDAKDVAGATSKQCVVKGGGTCTCTDYAIELGLKTKCAKVEGAAKCSGERTCLVGGLTACKAADPKAEECNGKDDDCDGQVDESTCSDGKPCTEDVCQGAAGCKNPNKTGSCDADSDVCTEDDTCSDGLCVAGKKKTCDDKNVCTKDVCDPKDGCKFTNAAYVENDPGNTSCNSDDNECTQNDYCDLGKCNPGKPKACNSGSDCVDGACNVITGACKYTPKDAVPCNDANACTTTDKCKKDADGTTSKCTGDATNCDDKNPCSADSCDATKGCQHSAVSGPCNDNDKCTENDACKDSACNGAAIDVEKVCDDNEVCTSQACNKDLGCINKIADGGNCSDGNGCTENDKCSNGVCAPGLDTCVCKVNKDCIDDGNLCNGTFICDTSVPGKFKCVVDPKTIIACDTSTNGQCQSTACDAATGKCKLTKKPESLPCNADNSVCTSGDGCSDGQCAAGKVQICNDNNVCTDDSCDDKEGCKYVNNTAGCDADGNACSEGDVCTSGSCIKGKDKVCSDNEDCTKDSCDASNAKCIFTNVNQSCTDGNACTIGDACGANAAGKFTCLPGKGPDCNDSNPCTVDTCEPGKGCLSTPDAKIQVPCYSGDPKTKGKGICKEGYQQCSSDAKLGVCEKEVLPGPKELCDGVDNNCDAVVDEGCAPTGFTARYASAVLSGQSGKLNARVMVGGSTVAGPAPGASGAKYGANYGFYAWVKKFLGL